jgi:hypothetical protein
MIHNIGITFARQLLKHCNTTETSIWKNLKPHTNPPKINRKLKYPGTYTKMA